MATIAIDNDQLIIEQTAVDTVLSLRSTLRFQISSVRGVTVDPSVGSEPKGIRAPGTHVPGFVVAGTFRHEGRKTFWNIRRGTNALVITLDHEDFDQLIVEVDDPFAAMELINKARG